MNHLNFKLFSLFFMLSLMQIAAEEDQKYQANASQIAIEMSKSTQEKTDKLKSAEEKKHRAQTQEKTNEEVSGDKKEKHKDIPEPQKLLKVGNLAFPITQQPTPLISFGQNLINERQFDFQLTASQVKGRKQYFIDLVPALIYGFRDNFSIYLSLPDAVRYRQRHHHSSGPEDFLVQLEYAPYTKEYYTYYNQISIVANVTVPTGSPRKNPPTGTGSNSFFLGGVFSSVGVDWFYFTSYGGILNASSHRSQIGNQFLYQYGVGRRIFNDSDWLVDWMCEITGQYFGKNKIAGQIDPNSGGNIIFITPSIFIASNQSLVVQFGAGVPLVQKWFGHQTKKSYLLQLKTSWAF